MDDDQDAKGGGIDSDGEVFSTRLDWSASYPPSAAILDLISTVTGIDQLDLEPLHRRIDPDALNELLDPSGNPDCKSGVKLTFPIEGYVVTVDSGGEAAVRSIPSK